MEDVIFRQIENDRTMYQKSRDMLALGTCKLILGEIHRDPKKDRSDKNVVKILKSLRKMTIKSPIKDPLLISMIDIYIPTPVSDISVITWVKSQYSYQEIIDMGKKSYSIIGKAKQHYKNEDINANCIKEFIDIINVDGELAYDDGDKPLDYEISVGPDIFKELLDELTVQPKEEDEDNA